MRNGRTPEGWGLFRGGSPGGSGAFWLLCIGWAGASASLLHAAPSRTEVAWVVALGWAWGLSALAAAWLGRKRSIAPLTILVAAALIRLPLLGTPPVLSDDVYRTLWEGLALLSGHNPFLTPADALPGLDDELRALVNHGEVPSAYPPLALLWFAASRLLGGTVLSAQALTAAVDLAIVGALLFPRADGSRRPSWPAVLYALHPLAALESAAGAHVDVPAVACLAWAVVLADRRTAWSTLLGVLGAGFKLFPALVLPSLAWRSGWRRSLVGILVGTVVLIVAGAPIWLAGPALLSGLGQYVQHWEFNGLVFTPLTEVLDPPNARRVLVPLGGLLTLAAAWFLRRRPAAQWLAVGAAFLALSPTAHPWYALWVVVPALLCGRWSGAVVGISIIGAYGVLSGFDPATGTWEEPGWLWTVTWVPGLLAVGVELGVVAWRRWSQRPAVDGTVRVSEPGG